jgi:hypothetical protein
MLKLLENPRSEKQQTQQREAFVQGRSLPSIPASV